MAYDYISQIRIAGELMNINTPANDTSIAPKIVAKDAEGRDVWEAIFTVTLNNIEATGQYAVRVRINNDLTIVGDRIAYISIVPEKSWGKFFNIPNLTRAWCSVMPGNDDDQASFDASFVCDDGQQRPIFRVYYKTAYWTGCSFTAYVVARYALTN